MKNYRKLVYLLIALTTAPFLVLLGFMDRGAAVNLVFGSLTGFVGVVLLFWQLILGTRFIVSRFSNDTIWFNSLHKNIGKYGVILIFFHPFLKAVSYAGSFVFVFLPNFTDPQWKYISYGRIAFVLLLLLWFTSVFLRKNLKYRTWLYVHYISYAAVFFVLLHAPSIGTYSSTLPYLKVFWKVLTWAYIFIVVYRLINLAGLRSYRYKLIRKERKANDISIYTFEPVSSYVVPEVGQYCYLQVNRFGESHPFTVMEYHPKTNELVFGIKWEGKYTGMVDGVKVGDEILIDGPYGVFTREGHNNFPKVILAGGIGVTPFVDLVRKYGDKNTYMFNVNRNLGKVVRREMFKSVLSKRYFDVISDERTQGENIINGRLDSSLVLKLLPKSFFDEANFFICGSRGFYDNYKKILLSMSVPESRIFYEEFGL